MVTPEQRRTVVTHVRTTVEVRERTASRFLGLHCAVIRHRTRRLDAPALITALTTVVETKRVLSVPRLTNKPRRVGFRVNPRRVVRLCRERHLLLRQRRGRNRVAVPRRPRVAPTGSNQRWSMDFLHDRLVDGRAFRVLTMLDEATREPVAFLVARRITGHDVEAALTALATTRGLPHTIAVDNGTEFTSTAMDQWATEHMVHSPFSRPGKLSDNHFIESFSSRHRDECLNEHWILSMAHAQRKIETFRHEHLTEHSHSSLGGLTPTEYASRFPPLCTCRDYPIVRLQLDSPCSEPRRIDGVSREQAGAFHRRGEYCQSLALSFHESPELNNRRTS